MEGKVEVDGKAEWQILSCGDANRLASCAKLSAFHFHGSTGLDH
jgi:hypothetical protein